MKLLNGIKIYIIAILLWFPFAEIGQVDELQFNWLSGLIGMGVYQLVSDIKNYRAKITLKEAFIGAAMSPFWLGLRLLIRRG